VYIRDPRSGGVAALELVDGVASAGLPPAHVGLHFGPVLFQQGDYYGRTVNLASRIAEYAGRVRSSSHRRLSMPQLGSM
jgi:class 3 adenylate cyclase